MGEMHNDGVLVADHLAVAAVGGDSPVLGVEAVLAPASGRGWPGKRLLDIVLASTILLVALPIFLTVALVIKLTSAGPVFFRQRRVGRGGTDFPMLKFRTMHVGSEERLRADPVLHEIFVQGSHKIPSHLDPRVTPVGRVLRRLSLDELPQLLNVLSGHMSMVGPRPVERSQLVRDYRGYEAAYMTLRPGLTGLWQVSGRSTVHFPERAEMDRRYLGTCGPWEDAKIILRTPRALLTGLGAD
jgi:lipopolysaccharide/colanic/teichoic acid biosynthesis glycosyltransferase